MQTLKTMLAALRESMRLVEIETPQERRERLRRLADAAEYRQRAEVAAASGRFSDAAAYRALARALGAVALALVALAPIKSDAQEILPYIIAPPMSAPSFHAPRFDANGNRLERRRHHEPEPYSARPRIITVPGQGRGRWLTEDDLDANAIHSTRESQL